MQNTDSVNTLKADQALENLPRSTQVALRRALLDRNTKTGAFSINHTAAANILAELAVSTGVAQDFTIHRSSVASWRTQNV